MLALLSFIVRWSLHNRVMVLMATLFFVAVGVRSAVTLPVDAVPDVTNVQVQIITTATALSPLEIEQYVTVPVERSMAGLPKSTEVRSISKYGVSVVTVVFADGTDIYWARQLVNERMSEAQEAVTVQYGKPAMGPITSAIGEVYQFVLRNEQLSQMELAEQLDWYIAPQLRMVPGIVEVNSFGGETRQYEVVLEPGRLQATGVSIAQVISALQKSNANAGGGYIEHNREHFVIGTDGLVKSLDDVRRVVIGATPQGVPITIDTVGEVRFGARLRRGAATKNGEGEVVVGVVLMLLGENARSVTEAVKAKLKALEPTLPPGTRIEPFYDRAAMVDRTITTVGINLLEGALLVMLVLFLLLGDWRAGVVVAVTIPLSLLFAVTLMNAFGLSGNLMSLGAIDFGLIVDGSVVLIENVVRRVAEHRHEHKVDRAPLEVVRDACREVARPIVFGVGIILLVYVPLLTLRGVEGKMFKPMALTVMFALLTSLGLALILMPVLASVFLRSVSEREPVLVRAVKAVYRPLLAWAMAHPRVVVVYAVAFFALSLAVGSRMGAVFLPKLDEGAIALQAIRLPSVSLETSVAMTTKMELCLKGFPEVETVVSKTGRPEIATDPMMVSMTDIVVMLRPRDTWRFAEKDDLVRAMQEALTRDVPGNGYSFSQPIELRVAELIAGVKTDVGISLSGDDLAALREKAEEIAGVVGRVRGAKDVAVEQSGGLPYLRVILKRDALARHGIPAKAVLDTVAALGGKDVSDVYEGQRRFPLTVRFPAESREDLGRLGRIGVADAGGKPVPLEQLAELRLEDGPAQVNRDAGRRRAVVTCNVRDRDLAGFVAEARAAVERQVKLPTGSTLAWGGTFKNLEEASRRLAVAVPIVLVLIFVLLHTTFGALRPALLIYLNVPMAATGGVVALALRGMDFSISAGVGFIALFGVAVLNGVVLVSSVVELRKAGRDAQAAAAEGALARMRPVLMTALVATLGFVPLALSSGAGAEVQKPLATVVIGGLATSTLLTLFVLPAVYRWFDAAPASPRGA